LDISIIIPTYNRLWSLPKAVNSCFDPNVAIEVIVIDDGSTDGTWEWLTQQENIVALRQENSGKDAAVNKGFEIAKGKYIRFLDSDDWLLPNSSAMLFNKAEQEQSDITCAGYQLFDEQENLTGETLWTVCDDFLAQQLGECDSSHYSAYLFKKAFINDIPHRQEYGALDDRQFIIEAAMKWPNTGYITTPTLAHRMHTKARLQTPSDPDAYANHLARLNIYKNCFDTLAKNGTLTQRHRSAACDILWHLAHWIAKTDIMKGYATYNWVYELDPNYTPAENLSIARLYKMFGFKKAEQLLRFRRMF
jgi:glycosyltransferase involved in cell wall biosynthesis